MGPARTSAIEQATGPSTAPGTFPFQAAATQDLNLGVIGNSIFGALIDRRARIVWCCWPRLDADPIFCQLLDGPPQDERDGFFEIGLEDCRATRQEYVGNSAILATTLIAGDGSCVRITDFAPRFKHYERVFRPTQLIRRVEPLSGNPRIRIRLRPRFEYGAVRPDRILGSNHIRYVAPGHALRLTTDAPVTYIAEEAAFLLDRRLDLILGPDEILDAPVASTAREYEERTAQYWNEWARYLSIPFEWQDAVIRAAITLKLCSFEETGAIIAAMTTSVPEAPNTIRNWDYRYCWLRDSYFVVHALNRLGATLTMEDYIRFITNLATQDQHGRLKPLYPIVPSTPLDEYHAPALTGYRGMGPVRVGNLAEIQVQNDAYGSVVLAAGQMFFDRRLPQRGDVRLFQQLEVVGDRAATFATEPDAGPWEYRGRQRTHTFSALMCWAACDRLAKIARVLQLPERAAHWHGRAEEIRAKIMELGWNPRLNAFTEAFGGEDMDASLLLIYELGFLPASDPRFLGTVAAIEKSLRRGNLMFRYAAPDDFGTPDTSFTICTFWYVDALAAIGRKDEARQIFEAVLARRNHLGLLSEDLEVNGPELWGNFPQSYSMVGLITSAMRLSQSWDEGFWRGL